MKSFAEVKRRIKVGTRLMCVENTYRPKLNGTLRTVIKVQTVAIAWRQDGDDSKQPSWTRWEKAAGVTILDDNTFRMKLFDDGIRDHYVEIRFLPEEAPAANVSA